MVELQYTTARRGAVALVAGVLDDRATVSGVDAYRVRVGVHIDGPVWIPAAHARADREEAVLETVLPAGSVRGIGAAGRGPVDDPPLEVLDIEPTSQTDRPTTPMDVLRVLGTPVPPRAAVPADPPTTPTSAALREASTAAAPSETSTSSETVPPAVAAWFDAVEARLDADTPAPSDRLRLAAVHTRAGGLLGRATPQGR